MSPDQLLPGTDDTIGSLRQSLSTIRLPVAINQRDRLLALMDADQLSLHELAHELLQVPVAALEVCRAAGRAARPRDIDILTLEQACGLLGTQRVANILKQLPVLEAEQMSLAFRQMLSISEHALCQARGLFSQRMARLWNEMSLGTLLFLAPFWALVYHRPDIFEAWERLHLAPGNVTAGDRRAAHGGPYLVLAQQLAEEWWLPPWIVQGYRSLGSTRRIMAKALRVARDSAHPQEQQAVLDSDTQLYRWLTQPANGLLLANGLALGAHHDWQARHTARWQQLTALYLGSRLDQVRTASHLHSVEHARASEADVWRPAEALLWPIMSRAIRAAAEPSRSSQKSAADPTVPVPSPAAPRSLTVNPAAWREHCAQLTLMPSPFANIPAILAEALLALTEGLGVKRCWIALYNARDSQMVIGASLGTERRLAGTRLGACRGTAWGAWLVSAASHQLGSGSSVRSLPAQVQAIVGAEDGYLLPLLLAGQLGGILHAEFHSEAQLPQPRRRPALEKTRDCLEKALLTFKTGS